MTYPFANTGDTAVAAGCGIKSRPAKRFAFML